MINAIWPNAVHQGQVAARSILGNPSRFEGSDIINVIDIFGTPVVAIGYLGSEVGDSEEIKVRGRDHLNILVKEDRILGFQGLGGSAVKYAGLIQTLMKKKADIGKLKPDLKAGNFKKLYSDLYVSGELSAGTSTR